MNKIILILFSVLSYGMSLAQENDSTFLRINKVAEVKKKQFIHAFPNNKDTCLLDYKKFDAQSRLTYQKVDMRCMGWTGYDETFLIKIVDDFFVNAKCFLIYVAQTHI